jgi:hypothetical protein
MNDVAGKDDETGIPEMDQQRLAAGGMPWRGDQSGGFRLNDLRRTEQACDVPPRLRLGQSAGDASILCLMQYGRIVRVLRHVHRGRGKRRSTASSRRAGLKRRTCSFARQSDGHDERVSPGADASVERIGTPCQLPVPVDGSLLLAFLTASARSSEVSQRAPMIHCRGRLLGREMLRSMASPAEWRDGTTKAL